MQALLFALATEDIINRTEFSQGTRTFEAEHGLNSDTYTSVGRSSDIFSLNSLSLTAGNTIDLQGSQFSALGDISLSAGLNVSNGRYSNKETVLSSITSGNSMTIDVEGNSHLVGSLIATQDEEGNDLGNLTFSTGTLTHTNLNNTSYSSNQSLSLNTNIGGLNTGNEETQNQQVAGNTSGSSNSDISDNNASGLRVDSSSVSLSNSTSFSKDKTLATIGLGNVTVGGETLGDDTINRDTSAITREFYDGNISQSVDASIDHRLFTEDGWDRIAADWTMAEYLADDLTGFSSSVDDLGRLFPWVDDFLGGGWTLSR